MLRRTRNSQVVRGCLIVLWVVNVASALPSTTPTSEPATIPNGGDQKIAKLKQQAREMLDAAAAFQNTKVLDLLYPQVIAKSGGRENILKAMDILANQMKSQMMSMISATLGEPKQDIEVNGARYVILPETVTLGFPKGTIVQESFLLGISTDAGQTWTFVDGSSGGTAIRAFLPELPVALNLPGKPSQIFTPAKP